MTAKEKWDLIVAEVEAKKFAKEEEIQRLWELLFVEIFGYSRIGKEIDSQHTIHIGCQKSTIPDIIIRDSATNKDLFVIELKQHNLPFNINYKEQLFSYMRLLELQVGILVCDKIYIYYREKYGVEYSIEIPLTKNSENGELFVELFSKGTFKQEDIKDFIASIEKSKENIEQIKSDLQRLDIKELLINHYTAKYSLEEIKTALENLQVSVSFTPQSQNLVQTQYPTIHTFAPTSPNVHFETGAGMDTTKYLFNGGRYGKGKLVLAVVKKYMQDHPATSAQILMTTFPKTLQGSLGVVKLVSETHINCQDPGKRYFLHPNDIIHTSTDDCAVCSQWGIGNIENFIRRARSLGMEIIAQK